MSVLAGEHFNAQASEVGVRLPPILQGEPTLLVDPSKRLSIHMADSLDHQGLPNEIRRATLSHIKSIGDYLMQAARVTYPDAKYVSGETALARSEMQPALAFLDAFTPAQKRLKTGHLRNFMAEVVMPDEIPPDIYSELFGIVDGHKRHVTDYVAYLVTTAELFAGRTIGRLGSISCIAVTGHGEPIETAPFSRIIRPPLSVSRPLTTNETLALAALQESQRRAHIARAEAMRHPSSGGLMH